MEEMSFKPLIHVEALPNFILEHTWGQTSKDK